MAKIKKTRKQKMESDLRHDIAIRETNAYSLDPQMTTNHAPAKTAAKHAVMTHEYGYLSKDLWKTILLTGAIILAEILIKQVAFNN